MRLAGVPVAEITTLTSILILPWIFKALWAPLVDTIRGPRWTLREWIVSMQVVMGLTLLPLAFLDFTEYFWLIRGSLLLHAVAASLQDASIDSLAISTVSPSDRGSLNGFMQLGYLTGRALFGGAILIFSGLISGFFAGSGSVLLLCGAVWGIAVVAGLSIRPARPDPVEGTARVTFRSYRTHLASAAKSKRLWIGLLFAGVSGAAFEGAGAVGGPFLVDRGLSAEAVGSFFSLYAVGGMILGSLAGGFSADRFGTARTVGWATLMVALNTAVLGLLDASAGGVGDVLTVGAFACLYLCIGFFTAATYAMFMNLTDPALGATQFSAYMGATNGCEAWSGFVTGRMSGAWGYPAAFIAMACVSALSLLLITPLHGSKGAEATVPAAGPEEIS